MFVYITAGYRFVMFKENNIDLYIYQENTNKSISIIFCLQKGDVNVYESITMGRSKFLPINRCAKYVVVFVTINELIDALN
jgi:hypothetical protein